MSSLDWSLKIRKKVRNEGRSKGKNPYYRGGIMPYCIDNGKIWFCMGKDLRTGDLTDFGGGIWKNETIMEGAFREFMEETGTMFEKFGVTSIEDLRGTTCLVKETMAIIFLPVSIKVKKETENSKEENISGEISGIEWVTEIDLFRKNQTRVWTRISNFFYGNEMKLLRVLSSVYV